MNIGINEEPALLGQEWRRTDLNVVGVAPAHLGERVVGETVMPVFPIFRIEKVLDPLRAGERDRRSRVILRPIGVRGEEHHDIAVDAFGEKRRGFRIEWRDKVPFGEVVRRIADGERDLYIAGPEGVAAERSVEAVPSPLKERYARVLAAEEVPGLLWRDDLLLRMEVDAVFSEGHTDRGKPADLYLERVGGAERSIEEPYAGFSADHRRIIRGLPFPRSFAARRKYRIMRFSTDDEHSYGNNLRMPSAYNVYARTNESSTCA